MKTRYFFVLLLALVISCKKDDDPTVTGPLLTYQTSPAIGNTDDWIFISDEEGNILDTKAFEYGDLVTLSSTHASSLKKINVTLLTYSKVSTQEQWYFTSYIGVPIGQNWTPGKQEASFTPTGSFGSAVVNFTNFPASRPLSERCFFSQNQRGIVLGLSSQGPANPTASPQFFESPANLYFTATKSGTPMYVDLSTLKLGSTITLDYANDPKPVDNMVTFNFPNGINTGTIYGVRKTPSADAFPHFIPGMLQSYVNGETSNTLKLGYNNGFDTYKTSILTSAPGLGIRGYYKIGTPPSTFPSLTNTVTVQDDSYKNFTFSSTGTYHMRSTTWYNFANLTTGQVTQWIQNAGTEGKLKIVDLPAEIKAKYPQMDLTVLKYQNTMLTVFLDGFTYTDYVNGFMGLNTAAKARSSEYQTISLGK